MTHPCGGVHRDWRRRRRSWEHLGAEMKSDLGEMAHTARLLEVLAAHILFHIAIGQARVQPYGVHVVRKAVKGDLQLQVLGHRLAVQLDQLEGHILGHELGAQAD